MSCSDIKYCTLPACRSEITIDGGLEAGTEIRIDITDKFGKVYSKQYTTDEDGVVNIDTTDEIYPEQLFNSAAGSFLVKAYKDDAPVKFTFCEIEYDAISFNLFDTTGEIDAIIKCNDPA